MAPQVLGVLCLLAAGAIPVLLLSLVSHQYEITVRLADLSEALGLRLRRLLGRAAPEPLGRPIEQIATDARRLSTRFDHVPRGLSFAKYDATRRAYDDVLIECCCALGIPERLSWLPAGAQRDLERRNLEFRLEQAGLRLRKAA